LRFGAIVPQGWKQEFAAVPEGHGQYVVMRHFARGLERLGFEGLWLYDHFHTMPDALPLACYEMWTTCAALAEATSSIRIGQLVGCNLYRSPALVAKMAASLDVICNGRLDFGLGAGWYEHEAVGYGYSFPSVGTRIDQLDEAMQIILGMWREDRFHYEGRYYRVGVGAVRTFRGEEMEHDGAVCRPRPVQHPRPPIWIGGGGERKTLRVVAKYADYANYGFTVEQAQHKNEVLDRHCEAVGRDPAEIKRTVLLQCLLGDPVYVERRLREAGFDEGDAARWRRTALVGSPQAVIDALGRFRDEARVEYAVIHFTDAVGGESVERFAAEVMPALS
jgi:F420-dependent oxidoreductase-like protein